MPIIGDISIRLSQVFDQVYPIISGDCPKTFEQFYIYAQRESTPKVQIYYCD